MSHDCCGRAETGCLLSDTRPNVDRGREDRIRHDPPSGGTLLELAQFPLTTAPELACPRCHAPLVQDGGTLRCDRHGAVAHLGSRGVLEFEDDSVYWGEIERDAMRRVLATARQSGWREALNRHLQGEEAGLIHYVQHPARADWRVLVPMDRERTVSLDVGAGWGAVSFGLAPHVLRHYAVERVAERIDFIALRKQQDGVQNLVPIRGDLHAVPLQRGSLDVIAVNGVLEWAGLVDPQPSPDGSMREPRELQESFLQELRQLLRPGGWLYVGIENRFGRMFWRGTPDHQGLRYTSLMPRVLARRYTRWRATRSPRTFAAEQDYRTWTYSLAGYSRLFQACGFEGLQCYAVIPGYNAPMQLVPLDSTGPFLYLAARQRSPRRALGTLRRSARWLAAASGLEKRVTSCYAFVMRAPGGSIP